MGGWIEVLGICGCLILSINYHIKVYYAGASLRSNESSVGYLFRHELFGLLEGHSRGYARFVAHMGYVQGVI